MKTTVKSSKDLRAIFPELSTIDRFTHRIDEVFKLGYSFEVEVKAALKCFTANNGKKYKAIIAYNGHGYPLKRTYIKNGPVTLKQYNSCPEIYVKIDKTPCGSLKIGNDTAVTYMAVYEDTEDVTWATLGKYIGLLIKDEMVDVCTCEKCGGNGFLPQFAYYADGVCFDCLGIGKWLKTKQNA